MCVCVVGEREGCFELVGLRLVRFLIWAFVGGFVRCLWFLRRLKPVVLEKQKILGLVEVEEVHLLFPLCVIVFVVGNVGWGPCDNAVVYGISHFGRCDEFLLGDDNGVGNLLRTMAVFFVFVVVREGDIRTFYSLARDTLAVGEEGGLTM